MKITNDREFAKVILDMNESEQREVIMNLVKLPGTVGRYANIVRNGERSVIIEDDEIFTITYVSGNDNIVINKWHIIYANENRGITERLLSFSYLYNISQLMHSIGVVYDKVK